MDYDWQTWLRVWRRTLERPPRRRWIFALLLLHPVAALATSLCLALDHLCFPGFRRVAVRAPIFVLGNARSGTTQIHRLLEADPGRFACFHTWEILLPSLLQRRALRWIGRCDARWLGGRLAARVGAREDASFAKARRMHDWRLDGAEEDGFLGLHGFGSGTLTVLFPFCRMLAPLSDLDALQSPRQRKRAQRFYAGCVQRLLYERGPERIFLSKNPAFVRRMRALRELWPDARFVFPLRHPCETTPSLVNLLVKTWQALGWDAESIRDSADWLRENQLESFRYAFEVIDSLPPEASAVVSFEQIANAPRAAVAAIYARFGLELSAAYAETLDAVQARSRAYRSEHRYDAAALGLPRAEVERRVGHLFARFGWRLEGEPVRSPPP